MSPVLGRARAPERRAVRGALDAIAALLAATGSPDTRAARHTAVTAVRHARRVVVQGALATVVTHVRAAWSPARSGQYRAGSSHRR